VRLPPLSAGVFVALAAVAVTGLAYPAASTLPAVPRKNVRPLVTAVVDPATYDTPQRTLAFRHTRAAGATFVRLSLDWRNIAPQRSAEVPPPNFDPTNPRDPRYRWGPFDAQVTQAVFNGLEPIVTITAAPRWGQRPDDAAGGLLRTDAVDFANFATAAARRYSGRIRGLPRVRYWQVWNEPNHPGRRELLRGAADWYRTVVNRFADAVHSVDRRNEVIAGGASPFAKTTALGPLLFMQRVLCMSAGERPRPTCSRRLTADIWAHHPYSSGSPTHKAGGPNDVSVGDMPKMTRVLEAAIRARHIVSRRQVRFWVTEVSWDTNPPDPKGVPIDLQARWTSEALYRLWANGVSLVTWWRIRDDPLRASFYQSGLYFRARNIRGDRPKRTFYALRFPFVAFAESGRVFVWGRTPAGRPRRVAVEQEASGRWRRLGVLRSDRYGIFSQIYATAEGGALRARLLGPGDVSLPFSLKVPPDRIYPPFGV
jgi:hypothetical protein